MSFILLVLARTAHFAAAMVLVAVPSFRKIMGEQEEKLLRQFAVWLRMAFLVEALSGAIWFWLVAAQMSGNSPWDPIPGGDLETVLGQTQFGRLWLLRLMIGIALGLTLFLYSRRTSVLLTLGASLLISLAWAGHAVAGAHHHVLHLVIDSAHLLLGAIWPGGLLPLLLFLSHHDARTAQLNAKRPLTVVQRFSQISLTAVSVLIFTGIVNGWLMLGSWTALFTTAYGWLLVSKVGLVLVMLGLGALNRAYLLPRLAKAPSYWFSLRKVVLAESLIALMVLLVVGLMGLTPPP